MQKIKCLIWDLDNTLWSGVLSENDKITLNETSRFVVKELDKRGILQSIASKNEYSDAWKILQHYKMDKYFIYPQIHWGEKSKSIKYISDKLNIGIDTIAFIDDQAFEREAVSYVYPEIRCFSSEEVNELLKIEDFVPSYITSDSRNRRKMYQNEIKRKEAERSFEGSLDDFLNTLNMELSLTRATELDLRRIEELTYRTHQLNSTGYTYTYNELLQIIDSEKHRLYVIGLKDKYGDYGKIGIVLLELQQDICAIRLFLLSCRVVSRGIGNVALQYLAKLAHKKNVSLIAEFIHNEKNRMMYLTFMLNGFVEKDINNKRILCFNEGNLQTKMPLYIKKFYTDVTTL